MLNIFKIFNKKKETKEVKIDPVSSRIKRGAVDVNSWRAALYKTDSVFNPSWEDLQSQYRECNLDASVYTAINIRKNFHLGREINLMLNGEVNEKATELFQGKWFQDFINHSLDSIFYGYSFVKIGDIYLDENKINSVELIRRENCNPKLNLVLERPTQSQTGTDINSNELKNWIIKISDSYDSDFIGLLNKIMPYFVYNRLSFKEFTIFTARYGSGNWTFKTDSQNEDYLNTINEYLSNLNSSSYSIMSKDDNLELHQPSASNAAIFTELQRVCNEAITKLILGSDLGGEKSFVGSADIRHSLANLYSEADSKFLENIVNEELIPRLINLGFTYLKDVKFTYSKESITINPIEQMSNVIALLTLGYEVEDEELSNLFGIKVKKAKNIYNPNV